MTREGQERLFLGYASKENIPALRKNNEVAHTGIDIATHLLLALYPAAAIFIIEIAARYAKVPSWRRYVVQGFTCLAFAVAYLTLIDAAGIAVMLFLLAPALFFYAKRIKTNPALR